MTDTLNLLVAGAGLIVAIIVAGYGYSQYKSKKQDKRDKLIKQKTLETKEIQDIRDDLNGVIKELESIKSKMIPQELMKQIIDALEKIQLVQIEMGKLEIKCNLTHKENK